MTPEPTPSQELREKIRGTKTFNYNVYFGVGGGDNAITFDEALDELVKLFKQHELSRKQEWTESLIKKLPKKTSGAYADGFNQAIDQITKTIKEQSKALRGVK